MELVSINLKFYYIINKKQSIENFKNHDIISLIINVGCAIGHIRASPQYVSKV